MDSTVKKWKANIEMQNKKLKAIREASMERLRQSALRRSISPKKEEVEEFKVNPLAESCGMLKSESIRSKKDNNFPKEDAQIIQETPKNIKEKETAKKTPQEIHEPVEKEEEERLNTIEDYAKKLLETIENGKQRSKIGKIKKIKRLLKTLTESEKEKINELETQAAKYRQQCEKAKEKGESTTTVISELEAKLFDSEKEKVFPIVYN